MKTTTSHSRKIAFILAGSIAALLAVQSAHAATITWGAATNDTLNFTSSGYVASDVRANGILVAAITNGNGGVLNGVNFTSYTSFDNNTTITYGGSSIFELWSLGPNGPRNSNGWGHPSNQYGSFGYTNGIDNTRLLTGSGAGDGPLTVTIGSLTIGKTYEIQAFAPSWDNTLNNQTYDGQAITIGNPPGTQSQNIVGTFTADATTQIFLCNDIAPAAITVRELVASTSSAATGNWNAAATWNPSGVPTQYTPVIVDTDAITIDNTVSTDPAVASSLKLMNSGSVDLTSGQSLTIREGYSAGFDVSGGTFTVRSGATLNLGDINSSSLVPATFESGSTLNVSNMLAINAAVNLAGANLAVGVLEFDDVASPFSGDPSQISIGRGGIIHNKTAGTTTVTAPLVLTAMQTWTSNSGTLALSGAVTHSPGALLSVVGGTITGSGSFTNDASGIIGAWATIGNGSSTEYAKIDAGAGNVINAYTAQTDATGGGLANLNDPTGNYSWSDNAVLSGNLTVNTLRNTGTSNSGTILSNMGFDVTLNGLLYVGNHDWLNFGESADNGGGNLVIGATKELVMISAGDGVNLNVRPNIVNNPGGASHLTVLGGGGGEWNFSGHSTYTGGTTLSNFEQINVNNTDSFGTGPITVNGAGFNSSRLANIANNGDGINNSLTLNGGSMMGGWDGPITVLGTVSSFGAGGSNGNLDGVVSGNGTVNIWGGGNFTFTNTNTYTGKTVIWENSTLNVVNPWTNAGVAGPLGAPTGADATVDLYNNARLFFTTDNQTSWTTDRALNLAGGGAGTVYLDTNNNDTNFGFGAVTATGSGAKTLALHLGSGGNGDREAVIFNGPISDSLDGSPTSLQITFETQSGSESYLSLAAVNAFTGSITLVKGNNVNSGYLTIGGVRDRNGNTPGSGQLANGNFPGVISLDTDTIFFYDSSASQILAGQISGAGTMTQGGSGALTLTAVNTYTGDTTVSSGTFEIGAAGQLGSGTYSGNIPVSNGATLKYNSSANQNLSGVVGNDGTLVKDNTGVLTLSGSNSGSGDTAVNGGVLRLNNAAALSGGLLTVNGGVVELASGDFQRNIGSGAGEAEVTGGTSGFSAYGAPRTVDFNNDAHQIQWDSATFAPTVLVLNASTANDKLTLANGIDLNGATRTISVHANTAEISGDIDNSTGTAGLTKTGSGVLILSGAHNYNGTTTVSVGELALNGSLTGDLVVSDGATVTPLTGASLTTPELTMDGTSSYKWLIGDSANNLTLNSHIQVNGNVSLTGTPQLTIDTAGGSPNPLTTYEILKYTGTCVTQPAWTVDYGVINASNVKNWLDGNSTWDTAGNWSGGTFSGGVVSYDNANQRIVLTGLTSSTTAPIPTSDVVIAPGNDAAVTGPAAAASINTLQLGNGTNTIGLTVQSGGPLTVTGATTINHATLTVNDDLTTSSVASSGTAVINGSGSLGTVGTPLSTFNIPSGTTSFGGTVTVHTAALAVGGTANLNAGSTVVTNGLSGGGTVNFDGGTLKANADLTLETTPAVIKAGGAVIDSDGHTVTVKQAFGAEVNDGGLTVQGAGSVLVKTAQTYSGATTIQNGGTLKLQGSPTAPPVTDYARWFDASTLGLANNDPVTQWNDGSINAANATVPGGNAAPTYILDAGTGTGLGAIQFLKNNGAGDSSALTFTRDSNIRTVFSIFKGSSFLLTDADDYQFHRPGDDDPAEPLYDAGYASGNITGGSTYVNGSLVDGTSFAMPTGLHNGYNLVEVLTTGNVQADSFNKDRVYHAGDQSHAEVIIYDRVLTEPERLLVEAYLNNKWFIGGGGGSNILPTTTTVTMASGTTLDLNGVSQQVASLADMGSPSGHQVLLAGGTLTIGAPSGETTFTGDILSTGGDGSAVEKVDASVQNLNGAQTYDSLTVTAGTLNVNGELGTTPANGTATVVVADNAKLKFGSVSQTLSSLTIGAGATVTFTSGVASGAFSGGGGKTVSFGGSAVVPEPGTLGLLLVGALGVLNRRRRDA